MRYRRFFTTTAAAFLFVILTGGLWVSAARWFGAQPGLVVTVLGAAFSATFVWLLLARLRSLLAHPERRLLEFVLLMANLAILIFTFAWVHHEIGLMDVSGPAPRPTNDLGDALYFSVVTSTTLGYGDFTPLGPGRPLAAIQALTGYIILGIIVSTGFQVIAPNTSPGQEANERSGAGESDSRGGAS